MKQPSILTILVVALTTVLVVLAPACSMEISTSFEQLSPGPLLKQSDASGRWEAAVSHATIHTQHRRTGQQCLRLLGGDRHQVTWTPAASQSSPEILDLWFERWTRRQPFELLIEAFSGGHWHTLHHDAQQAVTGSFRNHLSLPLPSPRVEKLRFTSTTPARSGVLLDDVRLRTTRPMRISHVTTSQQQAPVLIRNKVNPVLDVQVVADGSRHPKKVTQLRISLAGTTNLADIGYVEVLAAEADAAPPWHEIEANVGSLARFGSRLAARKDLVFRGSHELLPGTNHFFVSVKLKDGADVSHRIDAGCREVKATNQWVPRPESPPSSLRIGFAVRQANDDGARAYRIPGLVRTNTGTLIGVYDVRHRGWGDLPGDIDVGMSRSTDGGQTWEPMRVIMDMGDDPLWRHDGIGDPAVLVDRNTGTIWVAATWSHGNRSWFGSGPGLEPEETGQLMLVRSDDDGTTWSKPINITSQVKKPEWCFVLQGPGKGITMRDGTIVFAAQYQDPPNEADKTAHRLPHSTIIYSKDHGTTWQIGTGAFDDTTEAQVVELEPGTLMLNCRYNRGPVRVVMTTRDMGKTWQRHVTSQRSLIEPSACMASLINVDQEVGQDVGRWLLFSNPDSTRGRERMTIKASPDQGHTWPRQHRLLLDEGHGRGYSCMSMIDEETIGILYEGSRAHLIFQRIPLADLVAHVRHADKRPANPQRDSVPPRLQLPQVFGNHMILQAGAEIPVWGNAKPGAPVTVTLGNDTENTTADDDGRWQLRLAARKATATPNELLVRSDGERIRFTDVLLGEVWICAGQSNMGWPLNQSASGDQELAAASHPQLRLLNLSAGARGSSGSYTSEHLSRLTPATFCKGRWEIASAESAREFSAVAWHFGRHLQQELNVPVGLICAAVGGTPTEAWIPREAFAADPQLRGLVAGNWLDNERLGEFCRTRGEQNLLRAIQAGEAIPGDDLGPNHSFKPGFMWNAGIKPLIPYAIRGALWYQGESNAETPARVREHGRLLPLLVNQWRKAWRQGVFPFLYVQLPALNRSEWPWFRDGQRRALRQLKNVGMAVTIDTGHPTNVHPLVKKPIGERLAKWALGTTYGLTTHAAYSGPIFDVAARAGDSIVVSFEHVGGGLRSSDEQPLRYFEVCGGDGVFHSASAKIISRDSVSVSSPHVAEPHQVRYAWLPFPNPPVNLFNSAGLPASPFSTESEEAAFAQRAQANAAQRPNILFIVSEDNSDHLGCYGESRVHTPYLDALAADGVRYSRAYVPYSVCSPSRSAFLTGLYTRQNGQIGLATHRFSMYRDFKTIPAYFQQAGYYTGFLGKTHVNPERLVEDYVDHRAIKDSNFGKTTSIEEYADQARIVMRQAAKNRKPFLLIVNYADAHRRFVGKSKHGFPTQQVEDEIAPFPWIGSDTPHLREELRDYFNCMNRLDEGIGMVLGKLDEMGVRDNTLIVYISDHGADFPRGKGSIYENGTRIPMIVNYPRAFPRGKVESSMVSTVDILPTMLQAAGLRVPDDLPGFALQDIDSGKVPPRKYIHTFTTGSSPNLLYVQFGIRDERYKLVYNPDRALNRLALSRYQNSKLPEDQQVQSFLYPPEYELFDLQQDPHEWKNLADSTQHKHIKQKLLEAMQDFQLRIKDPFHDQNNLVTFIAEQKEYQQKPYRTQDFQWPHLAMFKEAREASLVSNEDRIISRVRDIPAGTPLEGHAKGAKKYGYRIPSLLATKKGSILTFSERRLGLHDHAQNDIVLRRSTDGGKTWSDEIIAYEDGMNSINDPLTVQLESGRILLMFARFPYGRHTRDAGWIEMAEPGYDDPMINVLTFLCHSDDDGLTWSKPVDISRQVKAPHLLNANTPGAMIQLSRGPHKGRVVTGLWGTLPIMKDGKRSRQWQIVVAYSDDNGQTWRRTEPLEDESGVGFPNECQIAEASNGDLVLVSRNQEGITFRKKAISHDAGETWTPLDVDRGLPSVACMGSVIKGPAKADGTWDLWASFPSDAGRKDGQIAVSKDHGATWRIVKIIRGAFAYSALQVSPDESSLLCLYESDNYRTQTLLTIPFDEIDKPQD